MNAFRLLIAVIILGRLPSSERDASLQSSRTPYEAIRLANQPLPADLRLHRHPREITPDRLRTILGVG